MPKITDVPQDWGDPNSMNRQQVIDRTMLPFTGASHRGVDASTMTGKVLCGYAGPGSKAEQQRIQSRPKRRVGAKVR